MGEVTLDGINDIAEMLLPAIGVMEDNNNGRKMRKANGSPEGTVEGKIYVNTENMRVDNDSSTGQDSSMTLELVPRYGVGDLTDGRTPPQIISQGNV